MIVMLEGLDRIGKSTCSNFLASRGYSAMHFSRPEGSDDAERAHYQMGTFDRMFQFMRALDFQDANIVMDRGHLGEVVYGPLYRPGSGVDTRYVFDMERKYGPFKSTLLILLEHDDLDVVRYRDDGQGFDIGKLETERDIFSAAFDMSELRKSRLNVTGLDISSMLRTLDDTILEAEAAMALEGIGGL